MKNNDIRKDKEVSSLNAIKTEIGFVKGRLYFSSKSTTTASVYLMQPLLDNWLKNKYHYIRFNIITFAVCLHLRFFTSLSF